MTSLPPPLEAIFDMANQRKNGAIPCQSLPVRKCRNGGHFDRGFEKKPYNIEEYTDMADWEKPEGMWRWSFETVNYKVRRLSYCAVVLLTDLLPQK